VTNATRSPLLPDIPIVGEFLPGYEGNGWTGIGAPNNTPAEKDALDHQYGRFKDFWREWA
jgi:hypothetical protein